jgi:hypothetical protein
MTATHGDERDHVVEDLQIGAPRAVPSGFRPHASDTAMGRASPHLAQRVIYALSVWMTRRADRYTYFPQACCDHDGLSSL